MTKLIQISIWKDKNTVWMLDIEKMKAKGIDPTPSDNASELARLIMDCLPSNTLDVLVSEIANNIRIMLDNPEKIEILKSEQDIESRIRIAIASLIKDDD